MHGAGPRARRRDGYSSSIPNSRSLRVMVLRPMPRRDAASTRRPRLASSALCSRIFSNWRVSVAITAELAKGNRKVENIRWQRFKGLGEMNVEELAECALDTHSRILRRITMDDAAAAAEAAELFETLMGNDVARRRQYLLDNSELVDRDALDV